MTGYRIRKMLDDYRQLINNNEYEINYKNMILNLIDEVYCG